MRSREEFRRSSIVTTFWLDNGIFVLPHNYNLFEAEFLAPSIKNLPVILSLLGAFLGFFLYFSASHVLEAITSSIIGRTLYTFFSNKWHWDYIYNTLVVTPIFAWGHNVSYKVLDRGLFEYLGPLGITRLLSFLTLKFSSFQSGLIYNYAFAIFIFSTLFLGSLGSWSFIASHADLLLLFPMLFFFCTTEQKVGSY